MSLPQNLITVTTVLPIFPLWCHPLISTLWTNVSLARHRGIPLPGIAIDDAERCDDGHADEAGQRHDDPSVGEALADHWRQEQRLAAGTDNTSFAVVVTSLIQVSDARHTLDEACAVGGLPRAADQEHPETRSQSYSPEVSK